ncbi:FkbM family methyltransferase [Actinocorallia sp. API 0066]|uniref:FkbM family methyltransferase n=1 Tax=Actinocorallia sp. API 0066 TaxID=2896846 RepID=UPI001E43FCCA|nr:FkbM family methyltransferase [Actinocorallia sp. API 0066]MCD0449446.1 FkbM family methyltransferase [Actinocorallia sp. API 0066]
MSNRIRAGDTVIDVGANVGYFTLLAAHLTGPTGHVVAIETAPHFHNALTQTIHTNGIDDVLDPFAAHGFHAYLLTNDYDARSYPDTIRRPEPPVRLHPPYPDLKDPTDLVLSRTDTDTLP